MEVDDSWLLLSAEAAAVLLVRGLPLFLLVVDKLGKLMDLVPAFTADDMPRRNPTAAAGLVRELGVTRDVVAAKVAVLAGTGKFDVIDARS